MTDGASAARHAEITAILGEVERVWRRNPHRPLAHLLTFATSASGTFLPEDASDAHVLARLRSVAPGSSGERRPDVESHDVVAKCECGPA